MKDVFAFTDDEKYVSQGLTEDKFSPPRRREDSLDSICPRNGFQDRRRDSQDSIESTFSSHDSILSRRDSFDYPQTILSRRNSRDSTTSLVSLLSEGKKDLADSRPVSMLSSKPESQVSSVRSRNTSVGSVVSRRNSAVSHKSGASALSQVSKKSFNKSRSDSFDSTSRSTSRRSRKDSLRSHEDRSPSVRSHRTTDSRRNSSASFRSRSSSCVSRSSSIGHSRSVSNSSRKDVSCSSLNTPDSPTRSNSLSNATSRVSSPEPCSPSNPPLPIPKLRIPRALIQPLNKDSCYKRVEIREGRRNSNSKSRTSNIIAQQLRSLNCRVDLEKLNLRVRFISIEYILNTNTSLLFIQKNYIILNHFNCDIFQVLTRSPKKSSKNSVKIHQADLSMLKTGKVKSTKLSRKFRKVSTELKERPPIAPIKIRLKNNRAETVQSTGKSLISVLAEIIKDKTPRTVPEKTYIDYPNLDVKPVVGKTSEIVMKNNNLSSTVSAIATLFNTKLCQDILLDLLETIVEPRELSNQLIDTVLNDVIVNSEVKISERIQEVKAESNETSGVETESERCIQPVEEIVSQNLDLNSSIEAMSSPLRTDTPETSVTSHVLDLLNGSNMDSEDLKDEMKILEAVPPPKIKSSDNTETSFKTSLSSCRQKIVVKIPKLHLSLTKLNQELKTSKPKLPCVKIKPIPLPSLEEIESNKKFKIKIKKKVDKLTVRLKGKKAAKIVKNSRMFQKKRILPARKASLPQSQETPVPETAKVSCVTVLKMSEIVKMKPKVLSKPILTNLSVESRLDLVSQKAEESQGKSTPNPCEKPVEDNTIQSIQIPDSSQTQLITPEKQNVEEIPELLDEFASDEMETSTRKVTVKDPLGPNKLSLNNFKTMINGIKPLKNSTETENHVTPVNKKISKAEFVPEKKKTKKIPEKKLSSVKKKSKKKSGEHIPKKAKEKITKVEPILEKKKTVVELIMEKIPPPPIQSVPSALPSKARRNSTSQRKEGWVTSTGSHLVAKKSLPEETVTFSIPPGGFKGEQSAESVPWYKRVDELFLQFYPGSVRSPEPEVPAPVSAVLDYIMTRVHQIAEEKLGSRLSQCIGGGRANSRMDNQRLVSSKGIQAVIDLAKYETGDKGECILMDQFWLTPDDFLQKTGNRSKNHRRSISVEGAELGVALEKWNSECSAETLDNDSISDDLSPEASTEVEFEKEVDLKSDKSLETDKSRLKNTGIVSQLYIS